MAGKDLRGMLADIYGFTQFRPHQEEIINAIMANRDVFAVMPTGGGKSLCYQLPACMKRGVTVVISPLISLMKDQVDAANANGIGAASLNSSLGEGEKRAIYSAVRSGDIRLLYISPERFNAPGFLDYLHTLDLAFFAVDEAHCVSEWGHDFRPDYLSLAAMTRDFPEIPVAAFTATATPRVAGDIVDRLGLRNPHLTRASFNRPNLFYRVQEKAKVDKQLTDFIRERGDEAGIVYRTTRKSVEATTAALRKNGIDARSYHAGLSDEERSRAQDDFRHDRCQVVVATIAFGMGIDKPNVRFVVHGDLPKNMEGYYQETGRAGRDGEPAQCLLLHSAADIAQLVRFNQAMEDSVGREAAVDQLKKMAAFARSDKCRRIALLEYFGERYPEENCGSCDVCMGDIEREDATIPAQKALSAMIRTGERFGATYIADVLTGANNEKIRQNAHHELPTYGVGRDRDKTYWRRVVEALVAKGFAVVQDAQYPTPRVTEKGWEVLRGESRFEMLKMAERPASGGRGRSRAGDDGIPFDEELFRTLRSERSRIASDKNIPPYMVFNDRSLRDMARLYPEDEDTMLLASGVGRHKLDLYGKTFMDLIRQYLQKHPGRKKPKAAAPAPARSFEPPPARSAKAELNSSEMETLALFRKGLGIEEVAVERGLRAETVVTHLEKLAASGTTLNPVQFMPLDRATMIARLFTASRQNLLRPVVESSGEEVSYLEARVVRALLPYLQEASKKPLD